MNDEMIERASEAFEDMGKGTKIRYWIASEFMVLLGYSDLRQFGRGIQKAIAACATLGIPYDENFKRLKKEGKPDDFNLSRFACYLVAMNSDTRRPEVAAAQAYFAVVAESFRQYNQESENVERVMLRSDVTEREKTLSSAAHGAGVTNYAFFQDAGYRGMYNMSLGQLKIHKGLDPKKALLDFMGKTELAAHLFRITQTEEKIVNESVIGQRALETTAHGVGVKVRRTMIELSGKPPEQLPLADNVNSVKTDLKSTQRRFKGMDTQSLPPGSSGAK